MSPVEPSPLVIGTIGLPSTDGGAVLSFLSFLGAASNSAGANRPPLMAPSADKKERRLQADFKFMGYSSPLRPFNILDFKNGSSVTPSGAIWLAKTFFHPARIEAPGTDRCKKMPIVSVPEK